MKILAFGDIHFHHSHRFSQMTATGYSARELEHLQCADRVIELCKKHAIDRVCFLGDCFGPVGDTVSCQTLNAVTDFFKKISDEIVLDIIVGNHDVSSSVNMQIIHKLYPFKFWNNINLYDMPQEVGNFVFMPYCISDDYAESFLNNIEDKENKIIFSHLEIKNIPVGPGILTKHGVDLNLLKKFKMTLQGHFHSGGSYGKNVQIAGSTQRLSFKDPGLARKNIIIYDTETNKVTRESFDCPDWLVFDDDTVEKVLNISDDNYVRLELTSDLLLTDEIKNKLDRVKGKDIHIDITRISVNRQIQESVTSEDEVDVIKQFVNKSNNSDILKEALINEGITLLNRVRDSV